MFSTITTERNPQPAAIATPLDSIARRLLLCGLIVGVFCLTKPYVLLASLGVCLLVFGCMVCVRPLHRVATIVIVILGYWLASGLISGGVQPDVLASRDFWRGEGRCFLFYVPLLATTFLTVSKPDLRFLVTMVCLLTFLGAILFAAWMAGFGDFQAEQDPVTGEAIESTYFVGFMTSHTGAGAFWATVAAFLFGFSLPTRARVIQVLALAAVLLTLGTGGRAATLGLVSVVVWMFAFGRMFTVRALQLAVPGGILVVAAGWGLMGALPEVNERMAELFDQRTVRSIASVAKQPTLHRASGTFYSGSNLEHHNLVIRVFLWKYALRLFQESPLIGIGYGRFNDSNLEFAGIPSVLNLAVRGEKFTGAGINWEEGQLMSSTGNAHNSYLHTLAETGLFGLTLLLYLWYLMYQFCSPTASPEVQHDPFLRGYCLGCQAGIVCLLATSLAGHALAAPSGGILLTTLIGSWMAYRSFASSDDESNVAARVET